MKVTVHVEIIARNVRPIRSENFEQSIRQCAWWHREVVLLKRDCSNSIAIISVAIEAASKRACFTWSWVVGPLSWGMSASYADPTHILLSRSPLLSVAILVGVGVARTAHIMYDVRRNRAGKKGCCQQTGMSARPGGCHEVGRP